MIVLDTHVLVWFVEGRPNLSRAARSAIADSAAAGAVSVSVVSFWEIGMLVSKNRLRLAESLLDWMGTVISSPGVSVAPLTPAVAIATSFLPLGMHADPADRFLVATARELDAVLVTDDRRILRYGAEGHVKVMAA